MKPRLLIALLLLSAPSVASAAPARTGRSPQVEKLGYYVGTWEGHGETKGGPFGQAGQLSSHQTCSWFAGGFQIICRGEEHGPTGNRQFLNILAYDVKTKAYTEYSISDRGEAEYDQGGSLDRRKLTFVISQNMGGKTARFRYTEDHLSPILYAYRTDVTVGGKPWTELAEGKIRKLK